MSRITWLCLVLPLNLAAQSIQPEITTDLDTAVITLGDRIHLSVTITHGEGSTVVWPDSLDLGPFELVDSRQLPTRTRDSVSTSAAVFSITAFELGDLELGSFEIPVVGSDTTTLATDGWLVTVESVGLDESGEIRSIKGPLDIERNWWLLVPWLLVAVAIIGATVWWIRKRRSREADTATAPIVPARPPYEVALEALDELEQSGLLDRGEFKEFHIRVSDIIRRYLEGRYGIDALELVTDEVVEDMRVLGVDAEVVDTTRDFLAACDLVKFARHTPSPEASRERINTARSLVARTRPVEQSGEAEEAVA